MKIVLTLILLLITLPAYGQEFARMNVGIMGGGVAAAPGGFVTQDDHQITVNAGASFAWAAAGPDGGFSWTSSSAYTLTKIDVKLNRTATGIPNGLITGYVHSDVGVTPSVAAVTNGTSSNTVDTDDLTQSYVTYSFTFPVGVSISNATRYWFIAISDVVDDSGYDNYFSLGVADTGSEAYGSGDISISSWSNDETSAQGWIITYSGGT